MGISALLKAKWQTETIEIKPEKDQKFDPFTITVYRMNNWLKQFQNGEVLSSRTNQSFAIAMVNVAVERLRDWSLSTPYSEDALYNNVTHDQFQAILDACWWDAEAEEKEQKK